MVFISWLVVCVCVLLIGYNGPLLTATVAVHVQQAAVFLSKVMCLFLCVKGVLPLACVCM